MFVPICFFSSRRHCLNLLILLSALSGNTFLFSQLGEPQPYFNNYTVDDGLPSSETYAVQQDSKGYIWICSDRGVSRFDGYKFENFTIADGLTDNVVFKIYEDHRGRIWFITYNSKLCYFDGEKIHAYRYNSLLFKSQQNFKVSAQKMIYIDKQDKLYISIGFNGLVSIDKHGKLEKHEKGKELVLSKIDGNLFWIFDHKDYKDIIDSVNIQVDYRSRQKIGKAYTFGRFNVSSNGTDDFLLTDKMLFSVKQGKKILEEPNAISLSINHSGVWIGTFKNGVRQIPDIHKPARSFRYLNGYSVSSILCDKEGGYWFSTLENGIFYTPSLNIKSYTIDEGLIDNELTGIAGIGDNIYLGYLLSRWQSIKAPYYKQTVQSGRNHVLIGNTQKNFYISAQSSFELKDGKLRRLYFSWSADYFPEKGAVLFGIQHIFRAYDNGKLEKVYDFNKDKAENKENMFQALMSDQRGKIWIGYLSGLAYLDKRTGSVSTKGLDNPLFKVRVADLGWHPDWKSIAATRGEGIYFFDDNKIIRQLKTQDGLLSDQINVIFIDASGGIWVGGNNGLNYITKNAAGEISVASFTKHHGLISNEISSIYVYKGLVYVGTKSGLSVIDTKAFTRNQHASRIYIKTFKTSTQILDASIHNILDYRESYIHIDFRNLNYRVLKNWNYQYRFSKAGKWVHTESPDITLINPLPGEYNLEIRYMNEDGIWSAPQLVCGFTIDEAFYKKWYFFAGVAILLGLLSWRIFKMRIRQLKRKHWLNNKINRLEQKALQAQMNPHFIFNALNSIQSFLVYEENEKAEKYLLKFAQLIRQTLVNSRYPYITIEGEIEILTKYLDLERMRFKDKFSYRIFNNLDASQMDLKIPNMLIQPFIENAVIHGFSTLDAGGLITITLDPVDKNQIVCIVEDNGVGRKKTMSQSSRKHVSFGTSITEERLHAFETKHGIHLKIETIDLENEDGTKGTRVVINLPVTDKLTEDDL